MLVKRIMFKRLSWKCPFYGRGLDIDEADESTNHRDLLAFTETHKRDDLMKICRSFAVCEDGWEQAYALANYCNKPRSCLLGLVKA